MAVAKIIGLIAVGGGAAAATTLLLMNGGGMPDWRPLSCDKEYSSNGNSLESAYSTKYGSTYSRFLVGAGTPRDNAENKKDNTEWWKWSFLNRYSKEGRTAEGKFKEVTNEATLTTKCNEAYKGENSGNNITIKATLNGDSDNNNFKEGDIWFYCSPAEAKIESITDANQASVEYKPSGNSVYGNDDTAKKDLVSVKSASKGNSWFWNFQQDNYNKSTEANKPQISNGDVKGWCEQAYQKTTADSNFSKENVFKWCSISGKAPVVVSGG